MISASDMLGAIDGTSVIILSLSQQFNPKSLPSMFDFASQLDACHRLARRRSGMARYRIYLRDRNELIVSHADADCDTDREACALAEHLIERDGQAEVWAGLRRVRPLGLSTAADRRQSIN